jgi:hypothetical protein
VTVVASVMWAAIFYLVVFSSVTVQDIDLWGWF